MFCTKCGTQLDQHARYCSQCGKRTAVAALTAEPRSLMLDKTNKKIAGVCAGFARYLDIDVTLVRVIWLAAFLTAGVGLLAYLAAWIIMPSDRGLVTMYNPQTVQVQP
jgi:phage shock protein C